MNWRNNFIALLLIFLSCEQEKNAFSSAVEHKYLIEAKDLKTIVNNHNIKILDFRNKELYDTEHIIGAMHISRSEIEDSSYPYRGIMASKRQIETLFSRLGINSDDTIIVYDDNGLCEASRLWWILQNYNNKNVMLLNGGLLEWKTYSGHVTTEVPEVNKTEFKLAGNPKMQYYVSNDQMLVAIQRNNTVILDTRTFDEFSGAQLKEGALKAGRIPNSMHIDWAESINYNIDKRLKTVKELENIYKKLNINKTDAIIVYCHSGVRSAHTTFVLTQLLGYSNVKNYDGSWIEWSYSNNLPHEKDSITKILN